jgi:hypothetical protein
MNHVAVITSAWLTLINPALAADATIDFLFSNDNQAIESKQFGGVTG